MPTSWSYADCLTDWIRVVDWLVHWTVNRVVGVQTPSKGRNLCRFFCSICIPLANPATLSVGRWDGEGEDRPPTLTCWGLENGLKCKAKKMMSLTLYTHGYAPLLGLLLTLWCTIVWPHIIDDPYNNRGHQFMTSTKTKVYDNPTPVNMRLTPSPPVDVHTPSTSNTHRPNSRETYSTMTFRGFQA